jgi:hypothetical protein
MAAGVAAAAEEPLPEVWTMTSRIHDEEDGKTIEVRFEGDNIVVTFKDGSKQKMPWDMWRHLAMVIVGMTEVRKQ